MLRFPVPPHPKVPVSMAAPCGGGRLQTKPKRIETLLLPLLPRIANSMPFQCFSFLLLLLLLPNPEIWELGVRGENEEGGGIRSPLRRTVWTQAFLLLPPAA